MKCSACYRRSIAISTRRSLWSRTIRTLRCELRGRCISTRANCRRRNRNEIFLPGLVQFEAQETAHNADAAVDRGGVRIVCVVERAEACTGRRREPGGRESVDGAASRVVYSAVAACLPGQDKAHSGRFVGFSHVMVRWSVSGSQEPTGQFSRRTGVVHSDEPGDYFAQRTNGGLAEEPDGRGRGAHIGGEISLEDRRSRAVDFADMAEQKRRRVGI